MPRLSKIGAAALAAFGWTGLSSVTASYLVVAGGGGGGGSVGSYGGGGGGAGGYQTGTASLNPTQSYTITVGAGGAGSALGTANIGTNGANSQIGSLTASVGGGGGASSNNNNGNSGGSGGAGAPVTGTGGTATSGQGNRGGNSAATRGGAGGGGFGSAGSDQTANSYAIPSNGVSGGTGTTSAISGATVTYAGGGGGGGMGSGGSGGAGGSSVGGAGANGASGLAGGTGVVNTGSGGGGGSSDSGGSTRTDGGNGGSGIVIISYTAPQKFGGGVVTTSGSNVIHTFNTSGTLSPLSSLTASYLIVAGGGGGGSATSGTGGTGAGGAGGLLSGSGLTIDSNSIYVVTVGAGGGVASNAVGTQGTNSSLSAYATSAVGGGYGGKQSNGGAGGSGGGAAYAGWVGGTATSGQGYAGGDTPVSAGGGAGGGGAGAAGANATTVSGSNGGVGVANPITGSTTGQLVSTTYYVAGGGGGGAWTAGSPGSGGNGGGGGGGTNAAVAGVSGTANTGGGGGGGGGTYSVSGGAGGSGGSGVVIIAYAGSTQQMAGGTVTITGGNVIHTFTSSGYLTPIKYVNNSLRFRSSASAYLNRTTTTPTSGSIFTHSFWVKRGILGAGTTLIAGARPTNFDRIVFNSTDTLLYQWNDGTSNLAYVETTQVFRDPAAWYHIVVATDTTQATASNRVKIYINGVLVTALTSTTYPSQNSTSYFNINAGTLNLGRSTNASAYLDGYLTEINFIDGQALTPNSFGTFNSYGVWQPITYGGSYGTNGFYLPFKTNGSTYVGSFSTSWLTLASNTAFNVFGGDMTVECWFNATSLTNSPHLFAFVQDATNRESIYFNSSALTFYSSSSAGSGNRIATGTISTGVWYHYALVKSGSTFTMYLNGVAVGTSTTTQYSTANQSLQIGTYNSGSYGGDNFSGYISNVRVVKGTAVYTSNFTPPTANLSAVTNTQLLTLQNASIIDNSTNAFSITNTNTVTTGQTYPFSASLIFNDQGPAGNNWTPNNISGAFGSTLDYMTDVPTLTSATAANYPVINPIDKTSYSITNANLSINTSSATWYAARASMAFPTTGKWYVEGTLSGAAPSAIIGIGTSQATLTNYVGSDAYGWSYYQPPNKVTNGTASTYGTIYTTGDTISVLWDAGAGSLSFYKNGVDQGVAFSGLASGEYFLMASLTTASGAAWNINFGQRPFSYTPPTGYVALNTYNM